MIIKLGIFAASTAFSTAILAAASTSNIWSQPQPVKECFIDLTKCKEATEARVGELKESLAADDLRDFGLDLYEVVTDESVRKETALLPVFQLLYDKVSYLTDIADLKEAHVGTDAGKENDIVFLVDKLSHTLDHPVDDILQSTAAKKALLDAGSFIAKSLLKLKESHCLKYVDLNATDVVASMTQAVEEAAERPVQRSQQEWNKTATSLRKHVLFSEVRKESRDSALDLKAQLSGNSSTKDELIGTNDRKVFNATISLVARHPEVFMRKEVLAGYTDRYIKIVNDNSNTMSSSSLICKKQEIKEGIEKSSWFKALKGKYPSDFKPF